MSPELHTLFSLYPAGSLALVGGYVRAYILGQLSDDTEADLATLLPPEDSAALLQKAGYLTESPGLKWGTVRALVNGQTYEITSTRKDVYAGNRYPTVTFLATWDEDAARRDFTCNAIYLFPTLEIFDPFDATSDLKQGLIRFIGNPENSLAQDPLRLLRFARFCALYGMAGWTDELQQVFQGALPALATVTTAKKQADIAKLHGPYMSEVKQRLTELGL